MQKTNKSWIMILVLWNDWVDTTYSCSFINLLAVVTMGSDEEDGKDGPTSFTAMHRKTYSFPSVRPVQVPFWYSVVTVVTETVGPISQIPVTFSYDHKIWSNSKITYSLSWI